jgi:hypothetical protein
MGCSDTNKKKLITELVCNCEKNLLRLINPSLAHVYCSTTLANHGLFKLKKIRLAKYTQYVQLVIFLVYI